MQIPFNKPFLKISLFYLTLACMILLILSPGFLRQSTYLDPNVYAGYIHNYSSLYAKYGQTYYSTRIAYLFPEMLSNWFFGNYFGFFSIRLLLMAVIAIYLHHLFSTYYNLIAGYAAGIFFLSIPWFWSSLKWTHYDGFAAGYLFLSMILLYLGLKKRRALLWLASGICCYLATNCNLILLPISGIFYFSVLISEIILTKNLSIKILRPYFYVLIGFFASFLALSFLYIALLKPNTWFLEKQAINMAISMQKGLAANWFVSFSQIWEQKHYFSFIPFLPILLLPFRSNIVRANSADPDQKILGLSANINYVTLLLFACYQHFYANVGWFALHYYLIYFFPAIFILFFTIVGINLRKLHFYEVFLMAGCLVSVLFITFTPNTFVNYLLLNNITIFVALMSIVVYTFNKPRYFLSACLIIFVLSQIMLSTDKFYKPSQNKNLEWGIFKGGENLQNFIDKNLPISTLLYFFYSGKRSGQLDRTFDAMQSRFLWGYSRLQEANDMKLPSDYKIKLKPNTYIAILGMSENEIAEAKKVITDSGLSYIKIDSENFMNLGFTFKVELIQIESATNRMLINPM